MNAEPAGRPRATCKTHPDIYAVATCSRCGDFLCPSCLADRAPELCEPCRSRLAHPALATPLSFGKTLALGARIFADAFAVVLPVTGICAAVLGLLGSFKSSAGGTSGDGLITSLVVFALDLLANLAMELALLGAMQPAIESRRRPTIADAIDGLRRLPRVIGPYLSSRVQVAFFFLLLVVPGVVKAVRLFVVVPAAYFGSRSALEDSEDLVKGSGWTILALVLAIFAPITLIGLGAHYAQRAAGGLGRLATFVFMARLWAGELLSALGTAVSLAAYHGLKARRRAAP